MALSEEFILKVADISHQKTELINLMHLLDEEKRSIRSFMRKYSNNAKDDGGLGGSERFKKLRSLQDRLSFLIEEREYVRQKLGEIKGDEKALNRIQLSKSIEFSHAFVAAAERLLSDTQFFDIERKASEMMMRKQ